MASNKTISIGFKIEEAGKDGFRKLVMDSKEFEKAMRANVVESERLHKKIIQFGQITQGIESVSSTINSLQATIRELTAAYDVQLEAEKKLEQTMRNTTGAVGLALTAAAAIATYFMTKTDEASESVDNLSDAERWQRQESELSAQVSEAENDARQSAVSSIELNIAMLKEFNETKEEEKKLVTELTLTKLTEEQLTRLPNAYDNLTVAQLALLEEVLCG